MKPAFDRLVPIMVLAVLLLVVAVCAGAQDVESEAPAFASITRQAMGTEFEFLVYPPSGAGYLEEVQDITGEAFAAIEGLERRISTWRPDSETSLLNRKAAEGPVEVGGELLRLLIEAEQLHKDTEGAFDVTVGPLLDLWGFYKQEGRLPEAEAMRKALEKVGFGKVAIDERAKTVAFAAEGMRLDFGGIGKGLALDWAAYVVRDKGVKRALLHAGTSTVVAVGHPPDAEGWTVRIRSPYNGTSEYLDEVRICDESLSTSSGAERFFKLDGKTYAHIFDPRTGVPLENTVLSSTAIAPTGTRSDGLSTAFFVMGIEKTRAFCEAHPEVRAILIVDNNGAPRVVRINFSQ